MRLRRMLVATIGCMMVLSVCIMGCGNTSKAENARFGTQMQENASSETKQDAINIEDIEWSVDEAIVDGERYVLLKFTNNLPYTVSNFEITFKEKNNLSQQEKEKFYTDVQTKFKFSDEKMEELKKKDISMRAETDRVVGTGKSIKNVNCYYFSGSYYLKSMEHFNLVEPDIATIKYIDDEQIHTVYYDFASQEYSSEDKAEKAYQWSETELGNKIPKPGVQVLAKGRDDKKIFMFDAYGLNLDQFNTYVEECKKQGYMADASSFNGFYSADNKEGYNVYLYYNENDKNMSGTVKSPGN